MTDYVDSELTSAIIKAFYGVYSELGYGFLDKVYENALLLEWSCAGVGIESCNRLLCP
jgi:GxxExxY protein